MNEHPNIVSGRPYPIGVSEPCLGPDVNEGAERQTNKLKYLQRTKNWKKETVVYIPLTLDF